MQHSKTSWRVWWDKLVHVMPYNMNIDFTWALASDIQIYHTVLSYWEKKSANKQTVLVTCEPSKKVYVSLSHIKDCSQATIHFTLRVICIIFPNNISYKLSIEIQVPDSAKNEVFFNYIKTSYDFNTPFLDKQDVACLWVFPSTRMII